MADLGYTAQTIREAYIDPLRSALMIDDRFPKYEDLAAARKQLPTDATPAGQRDFDLENAIKLLGECRQRNLTCDIENVVNNTTVAKMDHIGKSDLIILDYHLDPTAASSPDKALSILRKLAVTPNANLVIVYTLQNPLDDVRRTVAANFRGKLAMPLPNLSDDEQSFIQEWQPELTGELTDAYMRGDNERLMGPLSASLRQELQTAAVHPGKFKAILESVIEEDITKQFRISHDGSLPSGERILQMSAYGSEHKWISFQNVFVVFISKQENKNVFEALEAALLDWQPLPMRLMLAHIRNTLEAGGFQYEQDILTNVERLTGWFFHALSGHEPSDKRLEQLWSRLLYGMQHQMTKDVAKFGDTLLQHSLQQLGNSDQMASTEWRKKCLDLAKELAGAKKGTADTKIFHALNTFLCSEGYKGAHISTGTVCREVSAEGQPIDNGQWFLCVSPDCEMVPRPPKDEMSWTHDIDPALAVTILRLEKVQFSAPLKKAEDGKHVFINVDGVEMAFAAIRHDTGHPRSEVLFVQNRGITDDRGMFHAYLMRQVTLQEGGEKNLSLKAVRFQAVSQLRPSYADRLLHQVGHHNSRIGVDFINSLQ